MIAKFALFVVLAMDCCCVDRGRNLSSTRKSFRLDKFIGLCPNVGNASGWFETIKLINTNRGTVVVDFKLLIIEDILDPLQITWIVKRCSSAEALDTCVSFQTFQTAQFCRLLNLKRSAWVSFVECPKPKFKCPLKKGHYLGRHCTFTIEDFNTFPLDGYYWKMRSEIRGKVDKKMKMCVQLEGQRL